MKRPDYCELCGIVEATVTCEDCNVMLCYRCFVSHERMA